MLTILLGHASTLPHLHEVHLAAIVIVVLAVVATAALLRSLRGSHRRRRAVD
ncbi:MAG: hypothetical protein AAF721_33130 [Myxococcota bacterium]